MSGHVLVASNRRATSDLTKAALQSLDYNVEIARDLSLALYLANKNLPDVIIAEQEMVGGTGLELLKELSLDDELQSIPVIFLLDTTDSAGTESTALNLGAARVVKRPESLDTLLLEMMPFLNLDNHGSKIRPPSSPE